MKFVPIHSLQTERLQLRKLELSDAPQFYTRLSGSHTVTRFMLWAPHSTLDESVASIQKTLLRYDTGNCYRWGIVRKEDNSLIGMIDLLSFQEAENCCSFAYMLGEEFWNQGFGTEALRAVFRFAFEELEVNSIVVDHFAQNGASGAVMQKAGMVYLETIPAKYEKDGILHDAHVYQITKDMWNRQ